MIQETLTLPSQGYPYGDKLKDGIVCVRPITTKAYKDFLISASEDGVINLIDSCLVNCPIKAEEFVFQDELAIYIKIRSMSLGNIVPLSATCPSCKVTRVVDWDLMGMECTYLCADKYPFDITLPESNQSISVLLPTTKLQRLARSEARKRASRFNKSEDEFLSSFLSAVSIVVPSIADLTEKADWYNNLPLKDALYIDQVSDKVRDFGLTVNKEVKCSCGETFLVPLTINTDFFRPSVGDFDGVSTTKGTLATGPKGSAISESEV